VWEPGSIADDIEVWDDGAGGAQDPEPGSRARRAKGRAQRESSGGVREGRCHLLLSLLFLPYRLYGDLRQDPPPTSECTPRTDLEYPTLPGSSMRVLLSTIGSRGDVQPLVALAVQLRALGQDVRLCVPPDFREWIESLGFAVTPIGPEVRKAQANLAPSGGA